MSPDRVVPDSDELCGVGADAGLDAVGVASAEPFDHARREIERRRDEGLHGEMAFTFRNPARSTDLTVSFPWATAMVVGARSYHRREPPPPDRPGGRVARYAWADHYAELRAALGAVADTLRDAGWKAVVVADDNALVDRAAAHRAGLGWFGKNANVLLPGRGSWFVLGSVVTDAPLTPSGRPVADGCGPCTRCLDGCPTGAIVAPGVLDARRCLAWLVQAAGPFPRDHRVALGDRLYGCDDCQEVCPPNRVAARRGRLDPVTTAAPLEAWVELVELLDATDDELLARHGRWYVARRDPVHLRRNALVVLGNVGDPNDPEVCRVLGDALGHADPLIRAHAVWAARRLGLDELVATRRSDPDPLVQEELSAAVPLKGSA